MPIRPVLVVFPLPSRNIDDAAKVLQLLKNESLWAEITPLAGHRKDLPELKSSFLLVSLDEEIWRKNSPSKKVKFIHLDDDSSLSLKELLDIFGNRIKNVECIWDTIIDEGGIKDLEKIWRDWAKGVIPTILIGFDCDNLGQKEFSLFLYRDDVAENLFDANPIIVVIRGINQRIDIFKLITENRCGSPCIESKILSKFRKLDPLRAALISVSVRREDIPDEDLLKLIVNDWLGDIPLTVDELKNEVIPLVHGEEPFLNPFLEPCRVVHDRLTEISGIWEILRGLGERLADPSDFPPGNNPIKWKSEELIQNWSAALLTYVGITNLSLRAILFNSYGNSVASFVILFSSTENLLGLLLYVQLVLLCAIYHHLSLSQSIETDEKLAKKGLELFLKGGIKFVCKPPSEGSDRLYFGCFIRAFPRDCYKFFKDSRALDNYLHIIKGLSSMLHSCHSEVVAPFCDQLNDTSKLISTVRSIVDNLRGRGRNYVILTHGMFPLTEDMILGIRNEKIKLIGVLVKIAEIMESCGKNLKMMLQNIEGNSSINDLLVKLEDTIPLIEELHNQLEHILDESDDFVGPGSYLDKISQWSARCHVFLKCLKYIKSVNPQDLILNFRTEHLRGHL